MANKIPDHLKEYIRDWRILASHFEGLIAAPPGSFTIGPEMEQRRFQQGRIHHDPVEDSRDFKIATATLTTVAAGFSSQFDPRPFWEAWRWAEIWLRLKQIEAEVGFIAARGEAQVALFRLERAGPLSERDLFIWAEELKRTPRKNITAMVLKRGWIPVGEKGLPKLLKSIAERLGTEPPKRYKTKGD
jgi:hypothetical protein